MGNRYGNYANRYEIELSEWNSRLIKERLGLRVTVQTIYNYLCYFGVKSNVAKRRLEGIKRKTKSSSKN